MYTTGSKKKIAVLGLSTLMMWLIFFFSYTTVIQPGSVNVAGEITITELEDMLDEVDPDIRLRYGDRLFNESTGTYEQGYEHYLNLAEHYGILPSLVVSGDANFANLEANDAYFGNINISGVTLGTDSNFTNLGVSAGTYLNRLEATGDTNVGTIGLTNSFGGTYYGMWTEGSVLFTGEDGNIYQNNPNLFWSDSNSRLGIGMNTGFDQRTGLSITGDLDIMHTATENDDHAMEIDVNASGFGDVKGISINYITSSIAGGEEEEVILININESAATGGDVTALEVLATEGSATIYGLEAGALVNPVTQHSGIFSNMDSATVKGVDRLTEFISTASDIAMFVSDDDNITIGNAAKFEEIEFLLATTANVGIKPTFEFSTGVGTWTAFSPADGTSGFRNTGVIAWHDDDIPTWAIGTGSEYLIRITRTKNNLNTVPIEDKVQIASTTKYVWDKDGDIRVRDVNAERNLKVTGDANFVDVGISSNLYCDGNTTTNALNLFEPIHSKTTTILPRPNASGGGILTIDLWGNTNKTLYISNWAGHDIIGLDQDLRHDAASGATFSTLTVTQAGTKLQDLILDKALGTGHAGDWRLDVVAVPPGSPAIGVDGRDGKGTYLECGDGQASQYAGTSGDGGDLNITIGAKGVGLDGAGDGVDGQFIVTGLPTADPGITGALWQDWNNTIKISTG